MIPSPKLRARAYEEAAALLAADCDSADLPSDLTELEEESVREFIRERIVAELTQKATTLRSRRRGR